MTVGCHGIARADLPRRVVFRGIRLFLDHRVELAEDLRQVLAVIRPDLARRAADLLAGVSLGAGIKGQHTKTDQHY